MNSAAPERGLIRRSVQHTGAQAPEKHPEKKGESPVTTETVPVKPASAVGVRQPWWTHIALPSGDLDASVEFYTAMTPLVVIASRSDEHGRTVWLSNEGQWETPFVLVLSDFYRDHGTPHPTMAPFAHIGIEVPERADIDRIAEKGREMGCLYWEPRDMPDPIGYICALKDPDGNIIEFSHNQKVFQTVRELWGPKE